VFSAILISHCCHGTQRQAAMIDNFVIIVVHLSLLILFIKYLRKLWKKGNGASRDTRKH
jgi:hypothetical protein